MVYNTASDRVVLFGGLLGSSDRAESYDARVWTYDVDTNRWTEFETAAGPASRFSQALAYDDESDRIVLFGGSTGGGMAGDTWTYDLGSHTWERVDPINAPPPQSGHAMAYDAQSDRVILVGCEGETWAYDVNVNAWSNMNPSTRPLVGCPAITYDNATDRLVLFGGERFGYHDETWTYDYDSNAWAQKNPPLRPEGRRGHTMAFDSSTGMAVVFGGEGVGGWMRDMWAYDITNDTWEELAVTPGPVARIFAAMAYDGDSAQTILFGGRAVDFPTPDFDPETWAWGLSKNSTGEPSNNPTTSLLPPAFFTYLGLTLAGVAIVVGTAWLVKSIRRRGSERP